jgi:RNA polymerase sigma-70 factor (family 1)
MSKIKALSDNDLIQLLKDDDKAAFTEIYSRYIGQLAGFAGTKLYDLDDAHDILHDVFVKLWEGRHGLEISGNLKSYLFSATRHRIIDRIRRKIIRRDYALKLSASKPSGNNGADKVLEAKELQKTLLTAIERLPARTKLIYQLSRDEQLTSAEIAKRLCVSEQTVKNQLSIALKRLRQSVIRLGIITFLNYWF